MRFKSGELLIFSLIIMQPLAFPHGGVYQIISQESGLALTMQASEVKDFKGSRITQEPSNPNSARQLWMIEKIGQEEDEYEIINCISDFVMDEEGKEVKLRAGKGAKDQLYKVEKIPNGPNLFWIKTEKAGKEALQIEGILRVKPFDAAVVSQVFSIAKIVNSGVITDTSVLVNNASGKALDVPGGSRDPGDRIIQYGKNKRFNQRWRWIKSGAGGYILVNLLNGLALDIAGESKDNHSKVVQWTKTGNSNQLWNPVPAGNGLWKIQSVHAAGMCLAIHNESLDDGGKLSISSDGGPTSFWRFEDYSPK